MKMSKRCMSTKKADVWSDDCWQGGNLKVVLKEEWINQGMGKYRGPCTEEWCYYCLSILSAICCYVNPSFLSRPHGAWRNKKEPSPYWWLTIQAWADSSDIWPTASIMIRHFIQHMSPLASIREQYCVTPYFQIWSRYQSSNHTAAPRKCLLKVDVLDHVWISL